jgi:hypothetical protein
MFSNFLSKIFLVTLFLFNINAQAQQYFQQKVNTTIEVTLDDINHELDGKISIEYFNNSNDQLNEIYFLLYPNAFNGSYTKFAKQQLDNGSTKFHNSTKEKLGDIDNLLFTVNNIKVEFLQDPNNSDIGKLILNEPLKSNEKITIKTNFKVKIPFVWSRLGHVENYYACTQWFPKPAVFDNNGWHKYSYLDMGEFYYEYGNYDVKITLPKDYIVAATGVLQNQDEISLYKKMSQDSSLHYSSPNNIKTLHFVAENVHDFAWFASKNFKIKHENITLKSGKSVDLWGFYENKVWEKSTSYIKEAIVNYGNWVGEYSHPQCSAVEGPLKAGGGMEYPMVTIIDNGINKPDLLQGVIIHEVGHNWFQGILGSDERKYPWLDEGLNSFYENRTVDKVKEDTIKENLQLKIGIKNFSLKSPKDFDIEKLGMRYMTILNKTQAQKLSSEKYITVNYGLLSYKRTANLLKHLMYYLGEEKFDKCMQAYYTKWKYKHPQPNDLKAVFENTSGEDLSWFFDKLMQEKEKVDLKILKVNNEGVLLTNKGKSPISASLAAFDKDNKIIDEKHTKIIYPKDKLLINDLPKNAEKYMVDYNDLLNETNENNNTWQSKSILHTMPKLGLKAIANNDLMNKKYNLYVAPAMGYNAWNKFMLGAIFYNRTIMPRNFEFQVAPMYSFHTKTLAGTGNATYYYHPYNDGNIREIAIGLNGKTFGKADIYIPEKTSTRLQLSYYKLSPKVEITLANNNKNRKDKHTIYYQFNWIENEDYSSGYKADSSFLISKTYNHYHYNTLGYTYKNPFVLNPYEFNFKVQGNEIIVKTDVELKLKSKTKWNKRFATVRMFAGLFLYRKPVDEINGNYEGFYDANLNFKINGTGANNDFTYDKMFFARNIDKGFWSNQIHESDGFLKLNTQLHNSISTSNNLLLAMNVTVPFPRIPILNVYGDAMYIRTRDFPFSPISASFLANFGIAAKIIPDIFEIYFPIINLHNKDNFEFISIIKGNKYKNLITFRLELEKLNIWKSARNIDY